jgi:hypothetical protein
VNGAIASAATSANEDILRDMEFTLG